MIFYASWHLAIKLPDNGFNHVNCFVIHFISHNAQVLADNTIQYENGDRTNTPSTGNRCKCGYKHYWDGKEYDNLPVK